MNWKPVAIGLFLLNCNIVAAQTAEEVKESISIVQGFAANCIAIRSYDVRITEESFALDEDGKFREIISTYRMIADHDTKKYLFAISSRLEEVDGQSSELSARRGTKAFCSVGKQSWVRDLPHKAQRLKYTQRESLVRSQFPDLRLIGIYEALRGYSPESELESIINVEYHGESVSAVRHGEDSMTIVFDLPVKGDLVFKRTLKFDTQRLVPVRMHYAFDRGAKYLATLEEKIEWTEAKRDLFASRDFRNQEGSGESKSPEQFDITIEWLDLNNDCGEKIRGVEAITDTDAILAMLEMRDGPSPKPAE